MSPKPTLTYLSDYAPAAYGIDKVVLIIDLQEEHTQVTSTLHCHKNNDDDITAPLKLNGKDLSLVSISVDNKPLKHTDYKIEKDELIIPNLPQRFTLQIINTIEPQKNTSLEGLYKSEGMFCTQCEAQGFRKITYYLDRPDVMACFTTTIIADKSLYPILLSNGNRIDAGELENNRHFVCYEDPFRKPCYLFALVAGNLTCLQDSFTTQSGRDINLEFYAHERDISKCEYALHSLKEAMLWDEQKFDREYDLDTYMVVAVSDFNMGAMENKGLNIFNTACVLASPKTTTDNEYEYVLRVIGHEYFHNWTGNRITLRDWFQLSLKEGLTVFRDQEFTADCTSKTVKRIDDVNLIRTYQFAEDMSPMRHPVRPESYIEMDNFYTSTVYNKGAEVIRMLKTILNDTGFKKGMNLYFKRHDGQAITCDDFVRAFENANNIDLSQFMRWYCQDSTPIVDVKEDYDAKNQTLTLHFKQSCPTSAEQPHKKPFLIPIKLGFISQSGQTLKVKYNGEINSEFVILLTKENQSEIFTQVSEKPIPSLLRDFSAPVKLHYPYTQEDRLLLFAHDDNTFNRYEAVQQYMIQHIKHAIIAKDEANKPYPAQEFFNAITDMLCSKTLDKAFIAKAISVPALKTLIESYDIIPLDDLHAAREQLIKTLAIQLKAPLLDTYLSLVNDIDYQPTQKDIQARTLKNTCLQWLAKTNEPHIIELCRVQFKDANNMTDQLAALKAIVQSDNQKLAGDLLNEFYETWKDNALVMDKWFSLQAQAVNENTVTNVKKLLQHPAYNSANPNKVRALLGSFCHQNLPCFHAEEGQGYELIQDQVLTLDAINPHVSAYLARALMNFKQYDTTRQKHMRQALETLLQSKLSNNLYEIVSNSLSN